MKNKFDSYRLKFRPYSFILLLLFFSTALSGQNNQYSISPNYKKAITKHELTRAKTLVDINPGFPISWIERYQKVEIIISIETDTLSIVGKNEVLTEEQMSLFQNLNIWSKLDFVIHYHPYHSVEKTARKINFNFTLVPEIEASFVSGNTALDEFISKNIIALLSKDQLSAIDQMSLSFVIGRDGTLVNAIIVQSSGNEKIDNMILSQLSKMPQWIPATDQNGIKYEQAFTFSLGNMIGC